MKEKKKVPGPCNAVIAGFTVLRKVKPCAWPHMHEGVERCENKYLDPEFI
jgi:hypothetical protein